LTSVQWSVIYIDTGPQVGPATNKEEKMAILYREAHEDWGTQGHITLCAQCKEKYEKEHKDFYLDFWEDNQEPCDKCGGE